MTTTAKGLKSGVPFKRLKIEEIDGEYVQIKVAEDLSKKNKLRVIVGQPATGKSFSEEKKGFDFGKIIEAIQEEVAEAVKNRAREVERLKNISSIAEVQVNFAGLVTITVQLPRDEARKCWSSLLRSKPPISGNRGTHYESGHTFS